MHCQLIIATPSLIVVAVTPGPVPATCVVVAPGLVLAVEPVDFDEPVELAVHPAATSAATSAATTAILRPWIPPRDRTDRYAPVQQLITVAATLSATLERSWGG
jgi:hypothetical protein